MRPLAYRAGSGSVVHGAWGSHETVNLGGCCAATASGPPHWGQALTLDVLCTGEVHARL